LFLSTYRTLALPLTGYLRIQICTPTDSGPIIVHFLCFHQGLI